MTGAALAPASARSVRRPPRILSFGEVVVAVASGSVLMTVARIVMCPHCGGPLDAPINGGRATCTYCGVTVTIEPRPALRGPRSLLTPVNDPAERARIARLHGMARKFDASTNPYSLDNQPQGFEDIDGFDCSRATAHRLEGALRAGIAERDTYLERTLWWIGERLVNLWHLRGDYVRAEAVAQTLAEALTDPRLRQSVFCTLAGHARRAGDLDAAETWLAQCDPTPEHLELDNDYRIEVGMLSLARSRWDDALFAVGAVAGALPWSSQSAAMAFLVRTAAHEALGQRITADEDLREAIDYIEELTLGRNRELAQGGQETLVRRLSRERAATWLANTVFKSKQLAPCAAVWGRLAEFHELPTLEDAARQFREENA